MCCLERTVHFVQCCIIANNKTFVSFVNIGWWYVFTLVSWLHCLLVEHLSFLVVGLEPVSHLTKDCSDILNQSCTQSRKLVTNVFCTSWDVVVSLLQNVPPFKSRR